MRATSMMVVVSLAWARETFADEPRFHVTGAAAHAVGGTQEREFGIGGGAAATVELPVGPLFGVQASGGGLVLSEGSSPADATVAKQGVGNAFLGTVGVRLRPLGAMTTAGLWVDANAGLARTGSENRIAIDAHLGWDFRVSRETRWDVGPFVGYTQILQPDTALRPEDAHIVWAGLQISLGAREPPRASPPPSHEQPEPLPAPEYDGIAEVEDVCPEVDDELDGGDGCHEVKLVDDRIVIHDTIHFELDSPRIRLQSAALVRRIARFITEHPAILEVSIEGHADALGTLQYNLRLSELRARSTRAMLVRFGVDPARLRVMAHGKSHLKVATLHADERNRRVEFIVSRSAEATTSSPPPVPTARVASGKRGRP